MEEEGWEGGREGRKEGRKKKRKNHKVKKERTALEPQTEHNDNRAHTPQAIETSTDNCFIYSSPEIVETLLYCQTLSQAM